MSDCVALVTGSTSGIAAAIAYRLANDGYKIALHSRRSVDIGHATATELPDAGNHRADLAGDTAASDLAGSVLERHGRPAQGYRRSGGRVGRQRLRYGGDRYRRWWAEPH